MHLLTLAEVSLWLFQQQIKMLEVLTKTTRSIVAKKKHFKIFQIGSTWLFSGNGTLIHRPTKIDPPNRPTTRKKYRLALFWEFENQITNKKHHFVSKHLCAKFKYLKKHFLLTICDQASENPKITQLWDAFFFKFPISMQNSTTSTERWVQCSKFRSNTNGW